MDFSEQEITTEELIDCLKKDTLSDWQKLDLAVKLVITRKKIEFTDEVKFLSSSKDLATKVDSQNYLDLIIPGLIKQGKL